MENLAFLAPLLFISGAAVVVLAIIAVVQDLRQERKYGYRQAFYTIVTLVMLVMTIGSGISLMVIGLKQVMPTAKSYSERMNTPPGPYLTGSPEKGLTAAYTCTNDCQFTEVDKQNFTDWKTQFEAWKSTSSDNQQLRRDLAGGLSLFLVALPMFVLFLRWMNRGAKEETQQHQRPSPLRSIYFYGVAFAGLVMAVVGGAMLLNSVLKVALKTNTNPNIAFPTVATMTAPADSIITCAEKCGFSAADVALVKEWKEQNSAVMAAQSKNEGVMANDLANTIPYVLVGIPLFWYHFTRIRKETQAATPVAPTAT